MSTRASALSPAKARQMWSSILQIFRTVRGSCSLAVALRSTPRQMTFLPRTPIWTRAPASAGREGSVCASRATHRGGPLAHSLEGILDLEQVTVRREHGDGSVVARRHPPPLVSGGCAFQNTSLIDSLLGGVRVFLVLEYSRSLL